MIRNASILICRSGGQGGYWTRETQGCSWKVAFILDLLVACGENGNLKKVGFSKNDKIIVGWKIKLDIYFPA